MDRRVVVLALLAPPGVAPLVARAQQSTKIPRIGFLAGDLASNPHLRVAFD